jgi:hypothetical protein
MILSHENKMDYIKLVLALSQPYETKISDEFVMRHTQGFPGWPPVKFRQ